MVAGDAIKKNQHLQHQSHHDVVNTSSLHCGCTGLMTEIVGQNAELQGEMPAETKTMLKVTSTSGLQAYCFKVRHRVVVNHHLEQQKEHLWHCYRNCRRSNARGECERELQRNMPDTFYYGSAGERYDKERDKKLREWLAQLTKESDRSDRTREAAEREKID